MTMLLPLLLSLGAKAPACDAPEVRSALVREWSSMAGTHGDTLRGSEVKVWDLRRDGKEGECLADFLARRPGAAVGGTVPFRILAEKSGFRLVPRGEPRLNLLQADTSRRGR